MPDTIRAGNTTTAFALDGVAIKLQTRFLPGESFIVAQPGDELQAAVWNTIQPASEFTVIAVPFGTSPPTENVPPARSGIEDEYHTGFDNSRKAGAVDVLEQSDDGPTVRIFGKRVKGKAILAGPSPAGNADLAPTLTVEWVAEAGERLWIVRASQEMAPGTTTLDRAKSFLATLATTALSSDTLDQPTTIRTAGDSERLPESRTQPRAGRRGRRSGVPARDLNLPVEFSGRGPALPPAAAGNLPAPSWWKGDCNLDNFKPVTGRASFRLNNGFRGVVPCGPIPGPDGDRVVFFPDADGDFGRSKHGHGEFEFQCVELSMRFMQMAYEITAYPGNGSQVVPNFATRSQMKDRDKMEIIPNGQLPPAPDAGDILSYGPVTTVGHTSVCVASNVDSAGDGTITIIEQNNTQAGKQDLRVRRWQVLATPAVTSFLHFKGEQGRQRRGQRRRHVISPEPVLFPETGQFVGGGFKALWFKEGNGIFLCGFPLTGEQAEGDLTVQFFENVKMEFKPGIQPRFGPVGKAFVEHPGANIPPGVEPTGPGTQRFRTTGHSVGPEFLALFKKYGKAVCGEPLTGEIDENGTIAQYFENVRMERSEGLPARFGAVGRRFLTLAGVIPG